MNLGKHSFTQTRTSNVKSRNSQMRGSSIDPFHEYEVNKGIREEAHKTTLLAKQEYIKTFDINPNILQTSMKEEDDMLLVIKKDESTRTIRNHLTSQRGFNCNKISNRNYDNSMNNKGNLSSRMINLRLKLRPAPHHDDLKWKGKLLGMTCRLPLPSPSQIGSNSSKLSIKLHWISSSIHNNKNNNLSIDMSSYSSHHVGLKSVSPCFYARQALMISPSFPEGEKDARDTRETIENQVPIIELRSGNNNSNNNIDINDNNHAGHSGHRSSRNGSVNSDNGSGSGSGSGAKVLRLRFLSVDTTDSFIHCLSPYLTIGSSSGSSNGSSSSSDKDGIDIHSNGNELTIYDDGEEEEEIIGRESSIVIA